VYVVRYSSLHRVLVTDFGQTSVYTSLNNGYVLSVEKVEPTVYRFNMVRNQSGRILLALAMVSYVPGRENKASLFFLQYYCNGVLFALLLLFN
jgi:hypothetical protein